MKEQEILSAKVLSTIKREASRDHAILIPFLQCD